MFLSRIYRKSILGLCAFSLSLGTVGCANLDTLINNPNLQEAAKSLGLDLFLQKVVDGKSQGLTEKDIQEIKAGGKVVSFRFENEKLILEALPENVQELEIYYAGQSKPVIVPVDPSQQKDGRIVLRGVTHFEQEGDDLAFREFRGGYDFDEDGAFDEGFEQFSQDGEHVYFHDLKANKVRRFDIDGEPFDFNADPDFLFEGDDFFAPGLICKFPLREDGAIMVPNPDGSERYLEPGDFRVYPDDAVEILKEGEPDTGAVVYPPCDVDVIIDEPFEENCKFPLLDDEGTIEVPLPDGTPRQLHNGEYDVNPDHSIVIRREGDPDFGETVYYACDDLQMGQSAGEHCKFPLLDDEGTIEVFLPDGTPRQLHSGEYDVNPDNSIVVRREGDPDYGETLYYFCEDVNVDEPVMDDDCKFPLLDDEGTIEVPLPDGTPRQLHSGEYDLHPDNSITVAREGAPDFGERVYPCPQ